MYSKLYLSGVVCFRCLLHWFLIEFCSFEWRQGNKNCCFLTCMVLEVLTAFIVFPGKTVLIVNGAYRGARASLVSLDEKTFSVAVELKDVS